MTAASNGAKEIFLQALDHASLEEQDAFVASACREPRGREFFAVVDSAEWKMAVREKLPTPSLHHASWHRAALRRRLIRVVRGIHG
jgi:hypothetical protein